MTRSIKSVNVLVRIDFMGTDVSKESVKDALENMDYDFSYEDRYIKIVDTEIIDTFVPDQG